MEFWGKDKLLSVLSRLVSTHFHQNVIFVSYVSCYKKKKERYNLFTHVFGSLVYDVYAHFKSNPFQNPTNLFESILFMSGAKVKAGKTLKVKPDEDCLIHISQASLRKSRRGVSALLYATVDDKKLLLGTLSQDISFDHLLFDREFELSHTLERGSVHFTGYKSKVSTKSKPASDDDEEEAFVEMVCSAKKIRDLMYPSDPDDLLLTKQDLENLVPEKSTKVLTTAHSYPREDPDLTDSDEDFLSVSFLIRLIDNKLFNIDMDSTKADITNFFKDNCSLQVRIVQLVSTVDEESKKTKLEAHIEFRSNQELKLARKLNGHLMGKSRIFFDRTLGSLHVFFISGFNRNLREDDLKRQIEKKFKTCGALKKIILPKEQENLLGYVRFGYIVMNTTSEETVLSMDSSIMGDEAISVKSVNPRGRVFKALMESEN
ncbi:unnamed protein product [Brassica oleracea]